jgi:hypothetical protein
MASNLACIGLSVSSPEELRELLGSLLPEAQSIGRAGDFEVRRWQDPSGARITFGMSGESVVEFLPSFAARTRVGLQGLQMQNAEVASAAVVDPEGNQLTSMALEVEQRRLLAPGAVIDAETAVVALGNAVEVFADAVEFSESDASLLSPESADEDPPADYLERGLRWPPRVAATSFFSFGVFQTGDAVQADARLASTVRSAERRRVRSTGRDVVVAEVEGPGFDITLCLDGAEHPVDPRPGNVVSGTVFLTGDLVGWSPEATRRRWSLRNRKP